MWRQIKFICPYCKKAIVLECDDRKDHKLKCLCPGGRHASNNKRVKRSKNKN